MNREKLQQLADALHNPNILPDFKFDMKWVNNCVIGFCKDAGIVMSSIFTELEITQPEGCWMCSGSWANVDNTREGAALRIDYLLDTGLPENYLEQVNGLVPLSYRQ